MTAEAKLSDAVEVFLADAFPRGSTTLLLTPIGPEKEALLTPLVHRALKDDSKVFLALSNIPPRRLLRKLSTLGVDGDESLKDGRLRILDWYSHKEDDVKKAVDKGGVLRCPADLERLQEALQEVIGSTEGGGLAILEILTDIVGLVKARGTELASGFDKELRKAFETSILVADSDFTPGPITRDLQEQFEGLVTLKRELSQEEMTWRASIRRDGKEVSQNLLEMEPPFVDFRLKEAVGEDLLAVSLPERDAGEPCPECGGPIEGAECEVCGYMPDDPSLSRIRAVYERCEESLKEDPWNLDALFTKAAAQARLKEYEAAVQTLNELTKHDPRYPGMWMLKAKLFDRLGDELKASLSRQRALEIQQEETGLAFFARVQPGEEKFRCPLCNRWLPLDAVLCPCGAEFVEE